MALHLSVTGKQDVYISGKPSITYFSSVYKKAAPFVTEYVEYNFDNYVSPTGGTTAIITIPSRGDIITDICLKNVFSQLYPTSFPGYFFSQIATQLRNVYYMTLSGYGVALSTLITNYYYSTVSIPTWVFYNVTDITLTYANSKFTFSTTNSSYTAIGFKDETSASFFGFNILAPGTKSQASSGIIAYSNLVQTGYTVTPFTLFGTTISIGATDPYPFVSQDLNNCYISTGGSTVQQYIISSQTNGTVYTVSGAIFHTCTDFSSTLYVAASVNLTGILYSVNINTGVVTTLSTAQPYYYYGKIAYGSGQLFYSYGINGVFSQLISLQKPSFSIGFPYGITQMRYYNNILYVSAGTNIYTVDIVNATSTFLFNSKDTVYDFIVTPNSILVAYGTSYDNRTSINQYSLNGTFLTSYSFDTSSLSYSFASFGNLVYCFKTNGNIYYKDVTAVNVPIYSTNSQYTIDQFGWLPGVQPYSTKTIVPYSYKDSYALEIIKEARLYIGNQLISRTSGDYIRTLKDYETSYENRTGIQLLNGMKDNSNKYTPITTFSTLNFGIDNLPVASTYRHSTTVQIDFDNINNFYNSPLSDPLYLSSSYTSVSVGSFLNVPYQPSNVYVYSSKLYISENNGYTTTFDLNKTINDPTAYTRNLYANTIPYSSTIVGNYMYYSDTTGFYAQRILVSDYFNNIDSRTTATVPLWQYTPLTGPNNITYVTNDYRYVYYVFQVYAEYLNSLNNYCMFTGGSYKFTFFGITSISSSTNPWLELKAILNVALNYPNFINLTSQTTDGSNCYAQVDIYAPRGINWSTTYGTAIIVRYDTTSDFNSSSSYTFYSDITRSLSPGDTYRYKLPYLISSSSGLQTFTDGTNIYLQITDQMYTYVNGKTGPTLFLFSIANFTSVSSYRRSLIFAGKLYSPTLNDGNYIYFSNYGTSNYIYRFTINGNPESGQAWDLFDLIGNFSQIFSYNGSSLNQLTPGVFDGRYVYYTGSLQNYGSCIILKYDTTLPFTSASSYSCVMKHWVVDNQFVTISGTSLNVNFTAYSQNTFIYNGSTSALLTVITVNPVSGAGIYCQDILQINKSQIYSQASFSPTILTEYAYLDTFEKKSLLKNTQNIVYERQQTLSLRISPGEYTARLPFLNPVRELYISSNTYSNIDSFKLLLNGDTLFTLSSTYLQVIEPLESSPALPFYNTYLYKFRTPVNMSRLRYILLTINQTQNITLLVYARTLNVLVIRDGLAGVLFNSLEYVV